MSAEAEGGICGSLIAICAISTCLAWCNLTPAGAHCCANNKQSGCCGSCFNSTFDEDSWDKEAQKEEMRRAEREAAKQQPQPTQPMSTP
ncbi:hypothetical protein BD626DRAFT_627464 [Schizophyllum amplum]|uniref:Uncharacterized protein n=1 Tax=Schizophyllum amplum TaxID=97359 RepID=A0A550CQF4_9AGAR|nr:hypothetical protein BD626DRAFT_627464 [Auriculariopsis ampla]